jgi:hypothetical protein
LTDASDDYSFKLRMVRQEIERLPWGVVPVEPGVPKDLTLFGPTLTEAEDWIENERSFSR